jgi:DNA-binding transcriptional LysR family regulator
MEIRNLKTFLKVADLKNFTRAGVELGYSQTNVSAQIRQLEQGLGAPLFNRIGRHVTLTQYGEELLPYARRIVTAATEMDSFLKSDDSLGGTVRLGMAESLFDLAGEETVRAYHRRFPRVKLELTVDATAALEDGIRHGTLDTACLIDDPLPAPEWVCRYSREVPIVLAANPANALCTCREVLPEDLSGQEFVLMENSAAYSVRFLRMAAGSGADAKGVSDLAERKGRLRPGGAGRRAVVAAAVFCPAGGGGGGRYAFSARRLLPRASGCRPLCTRTGPRRPRWRG